jgi:acyl transferase domain-containing protein
MTDSADHAGCPFRPRTDKAIDDAQKWAVACTRAALLDSGWPGRPLDQERTAVILGNAVGGGEKHYLTARRVAFPETIRDLAGAPSFRALPAGVQAAVIAELHDRMDEYLPQITEDTMPGELGNCVAGRVANLFGLRGPNFVVDAACASTLAAFATAAGGLVRHTFDTAVCGGVDRKMGAWMFVKLSRMGALSATGSRPFDATADGFVMGEGAALFVLKRLQDAERAGDRIYAVVRGIGAASDGRGKAIAAPNPAGSRPAWASSTQSQHRLGGLGLPRQHPVAAPGHRQRPGALRGGQRVRLRRHQLPRRARGILTRPWLS